MRKILHDERLAILISGGQALIFYGQAQLVYWETLHSMAAKEPRVVLVAGEGVTLSDELDYPTSLDDVSENLALKIYCLRNDYRDT